MTLDARAALFIMLGQAAERTVDALEDVVPKDMLMLSASYDLAPLVPEKVRQAVEASEAYKLFFVFESYLRDFIVEVLSSDPSISWWDKVPKDVQDEVTKLEQT